MNKQPPPKRTVVRSLQDALRGIWCSLRSERNMRIHLTATLYVAFAAYSLRLSRIETALLALTIGMVISAEALNTAIEKHCDFNQKHYCGPIRNVKDIAAGGVLVAALAAIAVGIAIFWRPVLWQWLLSFVRVPHRGILLLLSFAVVWFFIFWGPDKIAEKLRVLFTRRK